MAYNPHNLSVLAYANGFTLRHYTTVDTAATADTTGYFNGAAAMLRVGDMIFANVETAGTTGSVRCSLERCRRPAYPHVCLSYKCGGDAGDLHLLAADPQSHTHVVWRKTTRLQGQGRSDDHIRCRVDGRRRPTYTDRHSVVPANASGLPLDRAVATRRRRRATLFVQRAGPQLREFLFTDTEQVSGE